MMMFLLQISYFCPFQQNNITRGVDNPSFNQLTLSLVKLKLPVRWIITFEANSIIPLYPFWGHAVDFNLHSYVLISNINSKRGCRQWSIQVASALHTYVWHSTYVLLTWVYSCYTHVSNVLLYMVPRHIATNNSPVTSRDRWNVPDIHIHPQVRLSRK